MVLVRLAGWRYMSGVDTPPPPHHHHHHHQCPTWCQCAPKSPPSPGQVPRLLLRENHCTVVDQPLEPAVAATCESDIFHALGLAYVPPHMRMFNTG